MHNLYSQPGKIAFEERCQQYQQQPVIFWFTGLSGAGKTTLAQEFEKWLFDRRYLAALLDADMIRKHINADLGFSMEDRRENIRRASAITRLFQEAGLIALATFISPTNSIRKIARDAAREGLFAEIYVKADIETCVARDPKGFYRKALQGDIKDYTGIASAFEPPQHPELVLDTGSDDVETCLKKIIVLANRFGIQDRE